MKLLLLKEFLVKCAIKHFRQIEGYKFTLKEITNQIESYQISVFLFEFQFFQIKYFFLNWIYSNSNQIQAILFEFQIFQIKFKSSLIWTQIFSNIFFCLNKIYSQIKSSHWLLLPESNETKSNFHYLIWWFKFFSN